jgi:PGF-pre-PGF domain-containing protein
MIRIALLIATAALLPILIAQLPYSASADSPILAQVATSTNAVMPSSTTIAAIEAMTIDVAVDAMGKMTNEEAVHVFNEMNTAKVVEMMGHMDVKKVSSIWGDMEPSKAGAVMEDVEVATASQIVGLVSAERLVARLPEVSPQKLWQMPPELLHDSMPGVNAMHLNAWTRPQVPDDLPAPIPTDTTDDRAVYIVPEARSDEWALVVGSPAPFTNIWAKFARPLDDIQVVLDGFGDQQPSGTPDLPVGAVANSFFSINLGGVASQDVVAAAAIAFVDKSWLDSNQIHKWSIQFSRFDENLDAWVPSPSKRIREDAERLTFAVVVPGFSTFAITGSRDLPDLPFSIDNLSIGPASPKDGEQIDVVASVSNSGAETAVYPAVLWVDGAIEAAKTVSVDAGGTAELEFTLRRPAGTYSIRLGRQITEVSVAAPIPRPPATGGIAPTTSLLALAGIAGLLLLLAGARLRRPRD